MSKVKNEKVKRWPIISKKERRALISILKSDDLSKERALWFGRLANGWKNYIGVDYAIPCSSGTAALFLMLAGIDIKPGDEVIIPAFTWWATAAAIIQHQAIPIFVDIEETTYNIDPEKIVKAITKRTKAILVVHIFGQSADMTPILEIAKKKKLKIIEDACESLGAKYRNKMTGTFGEIGVFAFYPNKQMTTGEGGIVVTNNKKIDLMIKSLKNQGRNLKNDWLIHERVGYNYRMDELSAAVGLAQIENIDFLLRERKRVAEFYNKFLSPSQQNHNNNN